MAKESYADYSIIHKYLQQEKLHEEEAQRFKDQVRELSEKLSTSMREIDQLVAKTNKLSEENESLKQAVSDRENDINRLNGTIASLNKKIAAMTKGGR